MKTASLRLSGWGFVLALATAGCIDPTPDDGVACPGGRCLDAVTGEVNAPDAANLADAVLPDVVVDPGASDVPGTDVGPGPCPQDYHAADQTPCADEGRRCGSDCADPCNWCNFLLCEGGKWIWFEVEPDPDCADDGGHPPADAVPDVAAAPPFRVSNCGGFAAGTKGPGDYCAQGILAWRREGDALVVTERRVLLNCCGDRAATVTREGDTWVLAETDAPEGGDGRCRCMCVFDFEVTVPTFPDGVAPFRIVRWVTDSGDGPVTTWEGDIVVGDAPGSVVVDPEPVGYGCATE